MTNFKLDQAKTDKFLINLRDFLLPLGILYLTTVIGIVSQDNHIITLKDFVPTQLALGGMILYILNSAYDYLKKLKK